MKLVTRFGSAALAAILLMVLAACGGGSTGNGGAGGGAQTIGAKGDELAFDKTEMSGPAAGFQVTFTNSSTVNQHNWVLVNGGDDVAARVDEAATAIGPDGGYLPSGPDVIAGNRVLNPGENATISVPATPAGTYTYICTVPGHYAAGMKGTLTVQ
jgi:plastocyanin